jgi:SOS-response transcriptional repressor LexA
MHALQKRLLDCVTTNNLGSMSLREIGELLGESHPQKVKHHLTQLEHKGLIEIDRPNRIVRRVDSPHISNGRLISIPILGSADCGPATILAEENIQGYLKISSKLFDRRRGLFAVRAVGDSMNKASISGLNIEHGDYVIVDGERRNPQNRDYVLSLMDGVANVKRFVNAEHKHQIVLISESTHEFPPIVIHEDDVDFFICGTVIEVIKNPSIS